MVSCVAISEDGKYLVSGSLDSTVVCFVHARTDMHSGVVHARIDFPPGFVLMLSVCFRFSSSLLNLATVVVITGDIGGLATVWRQRSGPAVLAKRFDRG